MKAQVEHKDILGANLDEGDNVAYVKSNNLYIGTILKINPKTVSIKKPEQYYWMSRENDYILPQDCVKLTDNPHLTFYLLKK